jgi:hypothetical protein
MQNKKVSFKSKCLIMYKEFKANFTLDEIKDIYREIEIAHNNLSVLDISYLVYTKLKSISD